MEGHLGPLRGTLPSAGLAENAVPMELCCEDLEKEGESDGGVCAHVTSSTFPPYYSCHSDMSLGDQLLKVLPFLTGQSHYISTCCVLSGLQTALSGEPLTSISCVQFVSPISSNVPHLFAAGDCSSQGM